MAGDKAPTKWNLPFFNELMAVKDDPEAHFRVFQTQWTCTPQNCSTSSRTSDMKMSTQAGVTIALTDMKIPPQRNEIIKKAEKEVDKITEYLTTVLFLTTKRYQAIVTLWTVQLMTSRALFLPTSASLIWST